LGDKEFQRRRRLRRTESIMQPRKMRNLFKSRIQIGPIILIVTLLVFYDVARTGEKPEVFVQLGHSIMLSCSSLSPDSRYALTGGGDHTLRLWDVTAGREIRTFSGHTNWVTSVTFSPDGHYALSGSWDSTLKLWEVNTGREIRTFRGHSNFVNSVAFSPDGRYALSGSGDQTLKLWDVTTGGKIRTFNGASALVKSVAFSPDGRYALSGCWDGILNLWDVATGREIRRFSRHSATVNSVAFSPDGRYALSGSSDNTLKLWDVSRGREIRPFSGHTNWVNSVAFSPDGRYAVSGSLDKTLKRWEVSTGKEIGTFSGNSAGIVSVSFSRDGHHILAGIQSNNVKLLDANTGREISAFKGNSGFVNSLAFSPDGRQILSGDLSKTLKLWDAATGREIRIFKGHSDWWVRSVTFSPDGRYALSGSGDQTLKLWDVTTGKELRSFQGHSGEVRSVSLSADGRYALSGSRDKTLKLWDVETGREVRTFPHSKMVYWATLSPDGRYALSICFDSPILYVWDVASGKEIRSLNKEGGALSAVSFSPDGRYALSASYDKTMKLWDMTTGQEVRTFKKQLGIIFTISFSPDGRSALLGSSDKTMKLWDLNKDEEIRAFTGHSGTVSTVSFSPDGRHALSGSWDGTIRVWDISTGKEIAKIISLSNNENKEWNEWVVITPEGYFNASKNGPAHINVRIGNRVFGLDQFYDVFYRPDIVEAKLKGEDITLLASTNIEEALKNPPPAIEFVRVPAESSDRKVTLQYKITSTGGGIGEVRLFHNGKLIQSDGYYREAKKAPSEKVTLLAYNSRSIKDELRGVAVTAKKEGKISPIEAVSKGDAYEGSITVDAISGENEIGLAAFNRNNTVQSILKTATFKSSLKPEDSRVYILSVGIDEYKSQKDNLRYAAKDAESIARKLLEQIETHYKRENVYVAVLKNQDATKSGVIRKINELSRAIKPTDVFVLFIASHGIMQSGLYSIVTHDYDGGLSSQNLINSNEIMEISKNVKALTQVFILDTCHAGGLDNFVSGLYDARMTVMAKNMGLHMFASASSTQEAMDGYKGENGMFTYTLLEGLNNNPYADTNKDKKVGIYEIGAFAKEQTAKYSKETGHSQTPVINNFGKDFSIYLLK
jgi:WD40 repeat protein